jgi:hypothetical protein
MILRHQDDRGAHSEGDRGDQQPPPAAAGPSACVVKFTMIVAHYVCRLAPLLRRPRRSAFRAALGRQSSPIIDDRFRPQILAAVRIGETTTAGVA